MQVLQTIVLAIHLLGMATVVGTFIVQMRAKTGFRTGLLLGGAITQVVSGPALIGIHDAIVSQTGGAVGDGLGTKYLVHLIIGVVVLAAAIVALVVQRRGGRVQPWFHTAGGLGLVNVLVAVIWPN